jgi:hypothetical protein
MSTPKTIATLFTEGCFWLLFAVLVVPMLVAITLIHLGQKEGEE